MQTWRSKLTVTGMTVCLAAAAGMAVVHDVRAQNTKSTSQKSSALNRKAAQAALHAGYQALTSKKTKQAITELSQAIKSGKLRSSEMAKALYYRGQAYRAAKRPADAIADLTSALWMKGALSERERKAAMALRQKTYQQLGVAGPALPFGSSTTTETTTANPQPPKAPTPRRPVVAKTAPTQKKPSGTWTAQTSPTKPATSSNPLATASNGVTNFFNNLFGGSANTTPTTGSVTTQTGAARNTTSQRPRTGTIRTTVTRAQTPTPSTRQPTGRYFIQVASVRDPGQAKTLASTVTQRHQALLQGRKPTIETGVLGNMGTFYLVRIRAFRTQNEAAKLCQKLLASGLDCLVNKG
ncbi:MAG: SPOR domain-containing protein [Pseudomonadota bacterium]